METRNTAQIFMPIMEMHSTRQLVGHVLLASPSAASIDYSKNKEIVMAHDRFAVWKEKANIT